VARRLVLGSAFGLVVALLASGLGAASAQTNRPSPVGSDPFRGGAAYSGDFPDPTVMRVGSTFYAYATTVAALNLPAMTSTDLRHWTARPASDESHPFRNDALPTAAAWAERRSTPNGRVFSATWAPSVVRMGAGRFVAAYAVPRASDGHRCISLATSRTPLGPFVDSTAKPLTCLGTNAIDPQIFRDRGAVWLLYKAAGSPDRLMVRRMTASASGFGPTSRNYALLSPRTAWEGATLENPAMIRHRKKLYLFYSANNYKSAKYATGYAVCRAVTGPCTRMGRLLATGPYLAGPGGATPFLDRAGRLRLVYHAWRTGHVGYPSSTSCVKTSSGCPQRRMYVAILGQGAGGKLVVRRRY
jgi:beta-xylosidase